MFTETQIAIQSVNRIRETLAQFHMHFNDRENKFLSVVHGFQEDVSVAQKIDRDGICIFILQE